MQQPPNVNPDVLKNIGRKRKKLLSADEYVSGIISGNRSILGQAITLVESSNPRHFELAQTVIENCLRYCGNSVRIGITGIPGAGKSTFIEAFGTMLTGRGRKVAVLAIDPSSVRSGGSILGDKTRMERLSVDPNAFIRPSPSAGTLGGVARKTRENIILCEAAGFETILVETVGVGQSEIAVASMVDFFMLLMVAGTGDELQGLKRGIMELADLIIVNKADGDNIMKAEKTAAEFRNAIHFFPVPVSGFSQVVTTCSSKTGTGIEDIWQTINEYLTCTKKTGYFYERRKEQEVIRIHDFIAGYLKDSFYMDERVKVTLRDVEEKVRKGEMTSYKAAYILLNRFLNK
jgi:LAO/AO transport system kinase